ncbi:hypothetical protein TrLO_g13446 [Triparma laevis f. longispina]|uniref:DM2 domain-containing protein n=1 Tax=Triparma laevis f. longispina TaxID=1714387 RepID=A0A9W7L0C5_9STRA|nr:hypothetical protein TrLO_g13446 [Triparma laevis f. longispina]
MSDSAIEDAIRSALKSSSSDLKFKAFFASLQETLGVDLTARKKEVKEMVIRINSEGAEEEEESEPESEEEEEEVESEEETEQPKGKSGFHKLNALSPQLSEFLGVERASRPDIVKRMWAYFKEHNLQNPKDKRQILLDDALQKVFKVKKFTMFTLNRHVAKHVYIEEEPRSPVKKAPKKKAAVASKAKKPAKAKNGDDDGKPKKPKKPINHPKFKLSADLAVVTGTQSDSRPGITKALWVYIRANNLQKPENKQIIICDDNFKKVMGGETEVTMFSMSKFIGAHLGDRV